MGDIINIDDFFSKMTAEQATEFLMKAMKNLKLGEKMEMEEYFSDITDYFKTIFKELKIEKVEKFEFVEYDYPRLVIITIIVSRNSVELHCFDTKYKIWYRIFFENSPIILSMTVMQNCIFEKQFC